MEAKAPRERSNRMSSARQRNDITEGDRKARGSRIFFEFFWKGFDRVKMEKLHRLRKMAISSIMSSKCEEIESLFLPEISQ
jgi:hypothetical protein